MFLQLGRVTPVNCKAWKTRAGSNLTCLHTQEIEKDARVDAIGQNRIFFHVLPEPIGNSILCDSISVLTRHLLLATPLHAKPLTLTTANLH